MDINILLALQEFRNSIGSIFTGFMTKMSFIGEMEVVLVIMALIYWCASKSIGTYLLMGWTGNRVVNGLLKVTACVYRPWIRDARIVPDSAAMAAATGYSFPSGHSMNAASLYGGGAIRKELSGVLRVFLAIIFVLIAFSRIFLGVHTPQDILIGSAAGLLVMWLTTKLMERIEANPQMDIPVMCAVIAVAIAVAIFAAVKSYPEDYDAAGKLLVDGAKMAKDTYKGVGWCIGFFAGWVLERRYIGFSTDLPFITRMTRLVTGLFSYYAVTLILKEILNSSFSTVAATILISFIQTFYVTFVFPWCIKRWEKQEYDPLHASCTASDKKRS
jgi:undecaprenyl-diphosphatase